jgi:hypothetical protein
MTDLLSQDDAEALKQAIKRGIADIHTGIPGVVIAFNAATNTVDVQPAIRKTQIIDDQRTYIDMPVLRDVSIIIPYAAVAGYSLTFSISPGDPAWIMFSERSIDNWQESGSVSNPVDPVTARTHSLSDPVALVGLIPDPNVIANYQADAIEMRNADRSHRVTVSGSGVDAVAGSASMNLCPDGSITLSNGTASITLNAAGQVQITAPGGLSAITSPGGASFSIGAAGSGFTGGTLNHDGVNVGNDHVHSGVEPGPGTTGGPQ